MDLLIEENGQLIAVEIKASQTYNTRLVAGQKNWQKVSGHITAEQYLIYAGKIEMELEQGKLLPWQTGLERV